MSCEKLRARSCGSYGLRYEGNVARGRSRRHGVLGILQSCKPARGLHTGAIAALAALAAGCAPGLQEIHGATMGTTFVVKYVGDDASRPAAHTAIRAALGEVDCLFSTYRPDSVVSEFNARRDTEPHEVGAEFVRELARALTIARATDGAFDPTVLPLLRIMPLHDRRVTRAPSEAEVAAALAHIGFDKLELVDATHVRKLDPLVEIDPNAFAKGYGVDKVALALTELGHVEHLVEIGGELRAAGKKPDGSAWRIGIEQPAEPTASAPSGSIERAIVAEIVPLDDTSIATSGDYRQFYESEGARVHHIIDPRTGHNAPSAVISVSVRARDCAVADALATAFMVAGPDAASAIDAALEESFSVLFLLRDPDGDAKRVVRRVYHW